jgi:mevalonate pyrophosphate decarboxylase
LATAWLRRGLIVTVFRRAGDGMTHFIAEKKAEPASLENGFVRAVRGVAARAADKDDDTPKGRINRLIARHANFGKAAPTYREMAQAAGLGSSQAALSAARRACGEIIASGAVVRETTKDKSRTRFVLPDGRGTAWLELRKGKTNG